MGETDVGSNGTTVPIPAPRTVGESLNARIKYARQQVESLCITKAKAEALGILDFPQEFMEQLSYGPF